MCGVYRGAAYGGWERPAVAVDSWVSIPLQDPGGSRKAFINRRAQYPPQKEGCQGFLLKDFPHPGPLPQGEGARIPLPPGLSACGGRGGRSWPTLVRESVKSALGRFVQSPLQREWRKRRSTVGWVLTHLLGLLVCNLFHINAPSGNFGLTVATTCPILTIPAFFDIPRE